MTDRLRAIEGLALVAALTAVFDGVHAVGDHWVNAAKAASAFLCVSVRGWSRVPIVFDGAPGCFGCPTSAPRPRVHPWG